MVSSAATEEVRRLRREYDVATVGDVLSRGARRFGEREMLVHRGVRHGYAGFNRWVNRIAHGLLEEGLRRGDAVASIGANSDRLLALYFAVAKVGAVNVPLNAMSTAADVADLLARSESRLFFYEEGVADRVGDVDAPSLRERLVLGPATASDRPLAALEASEEGEPRVAVSSGDPAAVIYTSGSTGAPKGCLKSHSNLIWSAINCQLETPRRADTVELFVIPASGIGFANFILPTLLAGGRVVLDQFEPGRTLELIERERTTNAFLAGTMLDTLLRADPAESVDLRSIELLETAYQLSDRLRNGIAARFPTVRYCYGSSEGTNWAAPPECFLERPDCVGVPKGLDSFRIVSEGGEDVPPGEIGEVVVRGPTVMQGYLGEPEATQAVLDRGELHTGDLGAIASDGMMRFRGRLKDMIKTGGMNVAAGEVEMAIARHPAVSEVAVIGVEDDRWGEAVHAVVAIERSARASFAEDSLISELQAHCRGELAGFKRPKGFSLVDSLPKNPGGKVAKGSLRELLRDRQGAVADL